VLPAYFGSLYAFIFYFLAQHSPNLNTPTSIISITAFYGICLVIFGYLSEKYSQKILMTTGSIANVLTMITLLNHRNSEALIIPIYALIFFSSMIIGPLHAWMIQQFPPEKRCRGLIFSVGLGSAIAYGTTTPLALYFYKQGHNFLIAGLYPLVLSLLTVWVVCNRPFSADTKTTPRYENI
jgi:sugar phosphate permease